MTVLEDQIVEETPQVSEAQRSSAAVGPESKCLGRGVQSSSDVAGTSPANEDRDNREDNALKSREHNAAMALEKDSLLDELAFYKSQLVRICQQTGTPLPVYTRKGTASFSRTSTQPNN